MVQLAACLLAIILLGLEFVLFGVIFCKAFRLEMSGCETVILGFFAYFGLFQTAALPLILLQRPFHELVILWLILIAAADLAALLWGRKEFFGIIKGFFGGLWRNKGILLAAVLLLAVFCCWFQATQFYMGWDTVHYIGTVDTTVYTDTMYVYNGASGVKEEVMNLRYALSAFYMHTSVLCRVLSVSGIMVQKYVIGAICILMHGLILFAMGRRLFPGEEKKALFMTGLVYAMHLGFQTMYSASEFLLIRGYEAKGFCANVVIPAVFLAILCLWEDSDRREHWAMMFLVCFSSVAISMSSLLIVPAMVAIMSLAEFLAQRSFRALWRGFLCAAPNGIYLIVYFLYTQGLRIIIK